MEIGPTGPAGPAVANPVAVVSGSVIGTVQIQCRNMAELIVLEMTRTLKRVMIIRAQVLYLYK